MVILPAIDLMNGKVVRLRQGRAEDVTVYSDNPAEFARKWREGGSEWLHVVDLDGAFQGGPRNLPAVRNIVAEAGLPVELGGGLRTREDVAAALEAGVTRVIIGSKACDSPDFLAALVREFGADRIAVGIDAKNGKVAIKGWVETTDLGAVELAESCADLGINTLIYTDVATDGMLAGPNLEAMREMAEAVGDRVKVIASGGVSNAADLRALAEISNLWGAIVGKALYDGKVTLEEALAAGNKV